MDNPALKAILAVIAGIIVGGAIVFVIEMIGHSAFPPPAGTDLSNPEHVARLMDSLPAGAFAMVLLGWFLGSFAGAYVALSIARKAVAAWAVAVVFILLTAINFAMIPHPMWMMAAGVLIPLASAWLALRVRDVPDAA